MGAHYDKIGPELAGRSAYLLKRIADSDYNSLDEPRPQPLLATEGFKLRLHRACHFFIFHRKRKISKVRVNDRFDYRENGEAGAELSGERGGEPKGIPRGLGKVHRGQD
jgi:hypothetical protein